MLLFLKNNLKKYDVFLENTYKKGFFKSFSIKKPLHSFLVLLNTIPYIYFLKEKRIIKNRRKNYFFQKIKKEKNIKFSLKSNIKVFFGIILHFFSVFFAAFNLLIVAFLILMFTSSGITPFTELNPISEVRKDLKEINLNENSIEMYKYTNSNLYNFNNQNEISYELFEENFINILYNHFSNYKKFPNKGTISEKNIFIQNELKEQYPIDNHKFIYNNDENGNHYFKVIKNNKKIVFEKKVINDLDFFQSFENELNTYYDVEKNNGVYLEKTKNHKFIIKKSKEVENQYSIINYYDLNTNNTFSNFLYNPTISNSISVKTISIQDEKVHISNINLEFSTSQYINTYNELINEFNQNFYLYLLSLFAFLIYVFKFRSFLNNESKRRKNILWISHLQPETLLIEDKRNHKINKLNKKISIIKSI
jgi:hypothetical protein